MHSTHFCNLAIKTHYGSFVEAFSRNQNWLGGRHSWL